MDGSGEQVHIQGVGHAEVVILGMAQLLRQREVVVPGPIHSGQLHIVALKQRGVHVHHVRELHGGVGVVLAADLGAGHHRRIQLLRIGIVFHVVGDIQRPLVGHGVGHVEHPEHVGQLALGGQVGQALIPGALIDGNELHLDVGIGSLKLGDQRLDDLGLAGLGLAPMGHAQGDVFGGHRGQAGFFGHRGNQGQHHHACQEERKQLLHKKLSPFRFYTVYRLHDAP